MRVTIVTVDKIASRHRDIIVADKNRNGRGDMLPKIAWEGKPLAGSMGEECESLICSK